jgi:hypothetical protein
MRSAVPTKPLSVLFVVQESDEHCASMLPGLRSHVGLVCSSPESAREAVWRGFAPDVAVIDTRLGGAGELARQLAAGSPDGRPVFVALAPADVDGLPACFTARLSYPASACELEQLLWRIATAADAPPRRAAEG